MHTIERVTGSIAARVPLSSERVVEALQEARRRTYALVSSVSDADLECVHSSLMSPLVWDLGHIAAYEDLWLVHRYGERPLLRDELAACTTRSRPRARCEVTFRCSVLRRRASTWIRCARARSR